MEFVRYLICAARAYKLAKARGTNYFSVVGLNGVPQMCVFIGIGREAWRVSQFALDVFRRDVN